MNSTTIKIDGAKLRELLESKTGKTIYQIVNESGYSKNVLSNAVHKGYASSAVQNIARLYGISPDEYKLEDPEPIKEPSQLSIDDIEALKRNELKRNELKEIVKQAIREETIKRYEIKPMIKEAILDTLKEFECYEICGQYDEIAQVYRIALRIKK